MRQYMTRTSHENFERTAMSHAAAGGVASRATGSSKAVVLIKREMMSTTCKA